MANTFQKSDVWILGTNIEKYVNDYMKFYFKNQGKHVQFIKEEKSYKCSLTSNKFSSKSTHNQVIKIYISLGLFSIIDKSFNENLDNHVFKITEGKNVGEIILKSLEEKRQYYQNTKQENEIEDMAETDEELIHFKKNELRAIKNILELNYSVLRKDSLSNEWFDKFNNVGKDKNYKEILTYWDISEFFNDKQKIELIDIRKRFFYGEEKPDTYEAMIDRKLHIQYENKESISPIIEENKTNIGIKSDVYNFGSFLKEIIDKNQKVKIPIYQRRYSWNATLIQNLLEDIDSIKAKDDENFGHFIGSLIFKQNKNQLKIIDGQQRFTTLLIILRCLRDYWICDIEKSKNIPGDFNEYTLPDENKETILANIFQHIEGSYDFKIFKEILNGNHDIEFKDLKGTRSKESSLDSFYTARMKTFDFLTKLTIGTKTEAEKREILKLFLYKILNGVFLNITHNNIELEYELFEKINTSSMKLSMLDLIKNTIFSFASNETLDSLERPLGNSFRKNIEDKFLNKTNKKINEPKIKRYIQFLINYYDLIEKRQTKKDKNKSDFVKFKEILKHYFLFTKNMSFEKLDNKMNDMKDSIELFEAITIPDENGPLSEFTDLLISFVKRDIYIPLIAYLFIQHGDFKNNTYTIKKINKHKELGIKNNLRKCLFEIEKYEVFFQVVLYRGQSLRGMLNKILLEIVKLNKTNDYVDPLTIKKTLSNKSILKTLNMPSIEKFINIIEKESISPKISIVILNRIEYFLSSGNIELKGQYSTSWYTKDFSLEHIIPQEPKIKEWNVNNLDKDEFNERHNETLNMLGNLLILSKRDNSKVNNESWINKRMLYEELPSTRSKKLLIGNSKGVALVNLVEVQNYSFNEVKNRTLELANILKEIYK